MFTLSPAPKMHFRKLAWATFAVVWAALVLALIACSNRVPSLEERAIALDRQLMCPICDGQTLDESHSTLAQQMKEVVREKLAAGETVAQIKAYFSSPDRYGVAVLAAPPASGVNIVLWVLPIAGTAAGLAGLYLIAKSMRRGSGRSTEKADPDSALLEPYMAEASRALGIETSRRETGRAIDRSKTGT